MSNGASEVITKLQTYTAGAAIITNVFVKLDSNGDIVTCGAGEQAIGVSMEAIASGKGGAIALLNAGNSVQVASGAAVTAGAKVASDAAGKAVDTTTADIELGQAAEGSAALNEFAIIALIGGQITPV